MTKVKFTKMNGLGNDYIYFDCIDNPNLISDPQNTAIKLSDRHFGIGSDGIVLISKDENADFRMRMFNSDGSEAEMCGNAIRCVGKYVYDSGYTKEEVITVMTGAGKLELTLFPKDGKVESVRVDMGEPELRGLKIPTTFDKEKVVMENITLSESISYDVTCVSMGNPHAVIFVDEITDEQVFVHGKELEVCEYFPNRINVEFCKVNSRSQVDMRVWERGAGETMACGTGASAVAVACILNGFTDKKVTVSLLGGDLEIEWSENNHVFMTGPATVSFCGEVEI